MAKRASYEDKKQEFLKREKEHLPNKKWDGDSLTDPTGLPKSYVSDIFNKYSFRKAGNAFRKHIDKYFTSDMNKEYLGSGMNWSEQASYIIGDGSYGMSYNEFINFLTEFPEYTLPRMKAYSFGYSIEEENFAKGGITKGKSHKEGGIPMEVKSTGQKVELEGGEGVINKRNMSDTKKHTFDGKQLTKCEIASEINSDNNQGVKIDCDDITGKKYKYKKGGGIKGFTNDPIHTKGSISVQRVGGSTTWNVAINGKPKGRVLNAFTKEQAIHKFKKTKDEYKKGGKPTSASSVISKKGHPLPYLRGKPNLAKKYAPSLTGAMADFTGEKIGMKKGEARGMGLDSDTLEKGGDVSDEAETPKIYVGDLRAYNEGRLIGKWIDLTDYDDGDEVGKAIAELMEEYSKEYHGGEETEHAIHDYENFSRDLYSEYMGNDDFNMIIQAYKVAEDKDIPISVITEAIAYKGVEADDLEEWIEDRYSGTHSSEEDWAYDFIEQTGGIENLGRETLEMYFNYDSYGRDKAMDYNKIEDDNYNTHYFQNYAQGGEISTFAEGGRTNTETAITILKQLGGVGRLKAFTGAKQFINHGNGVSFKIGNRKFNYVKILLTPMDLYDMTFMKLHGGKMIREEKFDGIYNDQLVPIFESTTGMYLSFENGGEVSEFAKGGQIEMFDSFEKGGKIKNPREVFNYDKLTRKQIEWLEEDYAKRLKEAGQSEKGGATYKKGGKLDKYTLYRITLPKNHKLPKFKDSLGQAGKGVESKKGLRDIAIIEGFNTDERNTKENIKFLESKGYKIKTK